MFTYQLTQNFGTIRRSDGFLIEESNESDWQLYEAWLAEGNKPLPAEPLPQPIRTIDARRLRLALRQLNLLDGVEAAIATLGKAAQIDWEYAAQIKEDYPLVLALVTNLGLDTEVIFTLAISLD